LDSLDGEIGKVIDFYFDDQCWSIRHLIVDTGDCLPAKQVLLSPQAIFGVNHETELITVGLTKQQIEDSPSLANHQPVSGQDESDEWTRANQTVKVADRNLRSIHEVSQYFIHALDGWIGHVEDFIIDDDTWTIRYLVVCTNNWWAGNKVLISPEWIERISVSNLEVLLSLSREEIKRSPQYSEEILLKSG
jgi:hypothetical protein